MSDTKKKQQDDLFEEELLPHIDALKTFAYHLALNEADANDLVQETYLKAYRFIDKYEQGTNAKAWLFKILKNAYINEYRKKSKRPTQVDYEEISTFHNGESKNLTSYFDLRDDLFDNLMGDEITHAINSLPMDYSSVILLCDIEGFTYEEIAKIIEIPIGTVRSRLFRARNLLKKRLKAYAEKRGYTDFRSKDKKANIEAE